MNRREAVKATAVLVGGVLLGSSGSLVACAGESPRVGSRVLDSDDQRLVDEIADTLLPNTAASPGAREAGVGETINLLLTDCHPPETHLLVVNGLREFRARCRERTGESFSSLPRARREELLREVDAQALTATPTHYFAVVRDLALRAYFSSEIGTTRALRYVRVPGKWVGCVPLAPGQPAWG